MFTCETCFLSLVVFWKDRLRVYAGKIGYMFVALQNEHILCAPICGAGLSRACGAAF
jgi:hypothetical protein